MNIQTLGKKISQKMDALIAKTKLRVTNNKYLLYFVLFLVLADLLIFAVAKDFVYIGIYILIGFIVKFFTKNMLIILVVSMIVTNVIRYGSSISVKEGLKNKDKEGLKNSNIIERAIKEELSKFSDDEISYLKSVQNGELEGLDGLSEEEQKIFEKMKEMASNEDAMEVMDDLEEEIEKNDISDEIEEVKEKEGMKSNGSASNKVEGLTRKVESLTMNNQKIKEAQNKLISSMKNLEPMLSQAETFMKQFAKK